MDIGGWIGPRRGIEFQKTCGIAEGCRTFVFEQIKEILVCFVILAIQTVRFAIPCEGRRGRWRYRDSRNESKYQLETFIGPNDCHIVVGLGEIERTLVSLFWMLVPVKNAPGVNEWGLRANCLLAQVQGALDHTNGVARAAFRYNFGKAWWASETKANNSARFWRLQPRSDTGGWAVGQFDEIKLFPRASAMDRVSFHQRHSWNGAEYQGGIDD